MIQFSDIGHIYQSVIPDGVKWTSITGLVHSFCKPFDADEMAPRSSRKRGGKWYGIPVEEIKAAWKAENERSIALGKWYHPIREQQYLKQDNAVHPVIRNGVKYAPEQRMQAGMVYPEHMVYLASAGICGQVDKAEVSINNVLSINDYKTCKEIKREGFTNWEGVSEKLLQPLQHLDKCEFNLYALQMSLYTYIMSRYNPQLIIGDLTIEHILFEEQGKDKYNYPVYKQTDEGDYMVKDIVMIKVPYLRKECTMMIEHLKERNKLVKQ